MLELDCIEFFGLYFVRERQDFDFVDPVVYEVFIQTSNSAFVKQPCTTRVVSLAKETTGAIDGVLISITDFIHYIYFPILILEK